MATECKTINDCFKRTVDRQKNRIAIEKKRLGRWESATWGEYYDRSRAAGLGLVALGVERGDRVSILSDNRLEWLYTDMGGLGVGAVIVPIYPTVTDEEVAHIVGDSGSKVLVVENAVQLKKAVYAKAHCPALQKIVVMNEEDIAEKNPAVMSFAALAALGQKMHEEAPDRFEKLAAATELKDLATLVYTSGTTGTPKGAMITHDNIMAVMHSLHDIHPNYATDADQTVPFLPLCHVFERITGHFYGSIFVGITSSYADSFNTLLEDFKERRPTMVLAVPRVLEKVFQKTMAQVQEQPPLKQKVFFWAQKVGSRVSELRELKKPTPPLLALQYKLAYQLVFRKLQDGLGGRVRWMTASGGPTAIEIIRFFNSAGITVISGYGMTECTAPVTMQNLADYRIGTCGAPVPGMEVKVAPDGEIVVKGRNVVSGYWNMEAETKEAFTADGYFMTGDIGEIDKDGYVTLTDRKKDLLITAGGKNVAPQKIENLAKSDPLFAQFIVVGDRRKYLSALYNLNLEQAAITAREKGIPFNKPEDLLDSTEMHKVVDQHVAELNKQLARYETIKRISLVRNEFSQNTGELTSTLKVKRKVVNAKYKDLIDRMYDEKLYE